MRHISGPWLSNRDAQAVFDALEAAGHAAYAVGGCVRNALLGQPVSDLDIATDATPEATTRAAEAAGLRAVPTGADHGTITIVSGGEGFEVTTFRADVETDGRRAVVRFSADITEDARRRDFTMNALYADRSGTVIDPLGGLGDLEARHVRFVGNASDRIREDYLRALRFFRFSAWYGDPERGFDPDALDAIARNLDGLDGLSRERVGAEMLKLLGAPDPGPALAAMQATGALGRLLAGADPRALAPLVHIEQSVGLTADGLRRLAVLGDIDGKGLRLSKAQIRRLEMLRAGVSAMDGPAALGYRHGAEAARDILVLRAALFEQPLSPESLVVAEKGADQTLPISAQDLMPALSGPALGAALKSLEADWIASDFRLTRADLLARAPKA
ncbi:CCA-adding enzyme [Roseivivax sp. THAF40]|uniref:CCA tRNA nucleotidyltransferase n=1 Tax=unclassified Roseivivax TaxID=2639302 RepID=UPI00126919AC|nr:MULTISPECIES: CCA tRNA nucleotidyltransferase [unclassified Roseivivax]QFS84679.1 CCA-adding enzyme [Roseivivax sp. THAF197b]QFT48506.1 CCA-adding enzyme [Roseivivax sp. THAF40]